MHGEGGAGLSLVAVRSVCWGLYVAGHILSSFWTRSSVRCLPDEGMSGHRSVFINVATKEVAVFLVCDIVMRNLFFPLGKIEPCTPPSSSMVKVC